MSFSKLTPKTEKLLARFVNNCRPNGQIGPELLQDIVKNYENLALQLAELSSFDFIRITWADNQPFFIAVTPNGKSYFDKKVLAEKEKCESRLHDYKVAAFGAVVGYIVGRLDDIIRLISSLWRFLNGN